jgi:hypothetical protein
MALHPWKVELMICSVAPLLTVIVVLGERRTLQLSKIKGTSIVIFPDSVMGEVTDAASTALVNP